MDLESEQTNLTIKQHSFLVRTGESQIFQSLDELLAFVQSWEENQGQKTGKGLK